MEKDSNKRFLAFDSPPKGELKLKLWGLCEEDTAQGSFQNKFFYNFDDFPKVSFLQKFRVIIAIVRNCSDMA